jgi:hypothetical protein
LINDGPVGVDYTSEDGMVMPSLCLWHETLMLI